MKNIYKIYTILLVFSFTSCEDYNIENQLNSRVKIALRAVGNELLLANNDTSSLVLPVEDISSSEYKLSFEKPLNITPSILVFSAEDAFKESSLPEAYTVEVINCSTGEVAYSYQINETSEYDSIPCSGRILPKDCYTISVYFRKLQRSWNYYFVIGVLAIFFILIVIWYRNRISTCIKPSKTINKANNNAIKIGSYLFYAEENKLIKEAIEISLSKKECEILEIFVASPNTIIKREELSKRVWEDKGVVVGRSLDTYISKLRKKLKEDTSVQLINVHGVGYKLEVK